MKPFKQPLIATATTGAISELIAAADLMKLGYSVFRALSPACSCDLLVMLGDAIIRIEVRSARLSPRGNVSYSFMDADSSRSDVLALVFKDGSVLYSKPVKPYAGKPGAFLRALNP